MYDFEKDAETGEGCWGAGFGLLCLGATVERLRADLARLTCFALLLTTEPSCFVS